MRNFIGNSLSKYLIKNGRVIATFAELNSKEDLAGLDLIRKIKEESEMLLKDQEAFLIYDTIRKLEKISGDIAEVGVYKGGSAKLIRCASKSKQLHLFDTYEGLPETSEKDKQGKFSKGELSASLDHVKKYLADYSDIYFYKGLFPSTGSAVADKKFSFVHLDVDLYKSTLDSLDFFYNKMTLGGVTISHNYHDLIGVRKAFDEFYDNKPEIIIEPIGTSQAFVVKV